MNGRLEKELLAEKKMQEKLKTLPKIFSDYYIYLRAAKKTYTTIDVYINYVIHFANFVGMSENFYKNIRTSEIEGYIISLETKQIDGQLVRIGSDIQCARWSGLNTFFEFLVKRGYISENPIAKTTRPKNTSEHTVTYLNKPEIKRIIDAVDKNHSEFIRIRDKTIISLALSTGMRVTAIINLNIDDLNFDEKSINVIEKGNKSRTITIGDNIIQLLKQWIVIRNEKFKNVNTNALLISQKNTRLTRQTVGDIVKKYTAEAGINKHITPHKLRSSAATNLAAAGVSIQAIAKQLGHSNVSITQKYVDVLKEEQAKTVNVLDNLF